MIRLGFEGSSIVGPRTGIGRATVELLGGLAEVWPEDWAPLCVWVNSPRHALPGDAALQSSKVEVRHTRWPGKLVLRGWQYVGWPKFEHFTGRLDLVHSPAGYIPPHSRARRIVTVHDLYFNTAPGHVEPYGGGYFRQTYRHGLAGVERVIAISEFTRAELLKAYPALHPEQVVVVPHGVDHTRFTLDDAGIGVRPDSDSDELYLLTIGAIEPRKNLERLVRSYQRAARELAVGGEVIPALRLQGPAGWGEQPWQRELAAQAQGAGRIVLSGYAADSELPEIYRRAIALIFPSLYEGFGLPVLEAMACGCPTALARAGALPEVGGDAALYFDPLDEEGMTGAILQICRDAALRGKLREAGLRRAALFSWAAAARGTIAVYRDVLKAKTNPSQAK